MLRLASLLWRLRRATAIDTGLLQLQSEIIAELGRQPERRHELTGALPTGQLPAVVVNRALSLICSGATIGAATHRAKALKETSTPTSSDIARCFLRLANIDNGAFERANRYETALWRQVGQVLLTLDFLRRTR